MTDKERLEEIKQTINHPNYTEHNGQEEIYFMVSDNDFNWLIQQAERAQWLKKELKHQTEHFSISFDLLEKQNKRYREALEFYAERDNYQWEVSYRPQQEIDCMVIDDSGHTARKALEDEE